MARNTHNATHGRGFDVAFAPPPRLPAPYGHAFVRTIGSGTTATVYLYQNPTDGGLVALKAPSDPTDPYACRRLRVEADILQRLAGCPFVLPLMATVDLDGVTCLMLAYAPSGSYRERMACGPMDVGDVLLLGERVAGALAAAHRIGVIHRDVKPANILIMADGMPALCDFDVAADAYRTARRTGHSRPWAAPEVVSGSSGGTEASDVYGLAATLYGLVTGVPPHYSGRGAAPMQPDVPAPLARLLSGALAQDPDERYGSAEEFRREIAHVRLLVPAGTVDGKRFGKVGGERSDAVSAATTGRRSDSDVGASGRMGVRGRAIGVPAAKAAGVLLVAVASGIALPQTVPAGMAGTVPGASRQRSHGTGASAVDPGVTVPGVTALSGAVMGGTAVFTWSNPDPRPGDVYVWRPVDASGAVTGAAVSTGTRRASIDAPDGEPACMQVDLVRTDGGMSAVHAVACVGDADLGSDPPDGPGPGPAGDAGDRPDAWPADVPDRSDDGSGRGTT